MTPTTTIGRRLTRALAATFLTLASTFALALPAAAGVAGPAFYVDGEAYRTVGTPTDFADTGAPLHSFDVIYAIEGATNVATAAPGDRDYNGGRWQVHAIAIDDLDATIAAVDANGSETLDSAEEVEAALAAGLATDDGIVDSFECPVVPFPRR